MRTLGLKLVLVATLAIATACGGSVEPVGDKTTETPNASSPPSSDPDVKAPAKNEDQKPTEPLPNVEPPPEEAKPEHAVELPKVEPKDDEPQDPPRDIEAERAACEACNGEWGVMGIAGYERCNCRTSDFGKSCNDGSECQGQCLAANAERVVTEEGPPPMGYLIGACSEFKTTFGCNEVLPFNYSVDGPYNLDEPAPMLCMD